MERAPQNPDKAGRPEQFTGNFAARLEAQNGAVGGRFETAQDSIELARRTVADTSEEDAVAGELVQLSAAYREYHSTVVSTLGAEAGKKDAARAAALQERARRLLAIQEGFAVAEAA